MKYSIIPIRSFLLFIFTVLLASACKKANVDYTYDYRRNQDAEKPSNVRLVNLSKNNQLIVNGDSLTNFFVAPQRSGYIPPEQLTPPGTHYFPKNGFLGQTWYIPQHLFQKDGKADLKTTFISTITNIIPSHEVEFSLKESYEQPKDYYLLINHEALVQDPTKLLEVPRSITSPVKPDHFKIRILNLSRKIAPTYTMEDLATKLKLAYADGTPVSAATSGIASNTWSEYVEIPYGTYQFKVLTEDGRQVPATGHAYYNHINRANSTMEMSGPGFSNVSSGLTYAPMRTFQPGGVYTIVIHPADFTWTTGNDDIRTIQNAFRIISDVSEPQNISYTQLQLANTVMNQDLVLNVKGQSTAVTAYGTASEYKRVVAGKQVLEVLSKTGQTLFSKEVELVGGQNYTFWVYADQDKQLKTLLVANNLAGTGYTGNGKDGTNSTIDRYQSEYYFNFRFLNFSNQLPYVTFTNGDGIPYAKNLANGTGVNVQQGILKTDEPYASLLYSTSVSGGNYQFMAYSSAPARVPGDWLKQITPLSSETLVANKSLYTAVGRKVPAHEPGVYSIAVIGDPDKNSAAEKARFMVIKHTK
ncbi:hypothetical protein DBR43_02910 [Pedobacter sp. KBW06]|uniref:DUF4397 domain-containing protein n=1 Tax=Pedobacter sp. KBW06 TaxID=2153359 RepID=UPI000F5A17FA|nr:DUF4397 domain-containing protein [Pedobacter sp. KBW06]RQO74362.1 hypothetical protein DBR43_02910 [Pedobacter sp. KBW06]